SEATTADRSLEHYPRALRASTCAIDCHPSPSETGRARESRETRRIVTDTTHEGAAAPEKDQAIETTPTAVPVEYSVRVVRLGDIVPVAVEPEAAPDITDSGNEAQTQFFQQFVDANLLSH
ncbi:MAG: hypothetical protein QP772_08500, partial [Actinomycetaceae bacterium UMB1218B]|nr:hypothetical protein [Actinomycetaceae bacterium UMB1218B]